MNFNTSSQDDACFARFIIRLLRSFSDCNARVLDTENLLMDDTSEATQEGG